MDKIYRFNREDMLDILSEHITDTEIFVDKKLSTVSIETFETGSGINFYVNLKVGCDAKE